MMTLYSGTTDPFSQRCRIVLHEKGMDFQIIDVDLDHKPEDLAVMNPYNQVPVLVERDLVLHESNIINEYIDERFPHPQLMPADPVMRARARITGSAGISCGCGKRSSMYSLMMFDSCSTRSRSTSTGTWLYGFITARSSGLWSRSTSMI